MVSIKLMTRLTKRRRSSLLLLIHCTVALVPCVLAVSRQQPPRKVSRRAFVASLLVQAPLAANAVKDCFADCSSNCKRLAPGSDAYCTLTCRDYCEQPDRRDGLSGSVGSEGAEIGLRSAFDLPAKASGKISGVPYGEDKPPALPDFLNIDGLMRAGSKKQ